MNTYFARHTWKMDVDQATRDRIWNEQRVALHFPQDRSGQLPAEDNSSLNPEDYPASGRKAMRALVALARDGGFVCAEYHDQDSALVGKVDPGTPIELIEGGWGAIWGNQGRKAVLKTLRLKAVKALPRSESAVILVGRPRQGTLMKWPKAGSAIHDLVGGVTPPDSLGTLSADQQEIICGEFLRLPEAESHGLPRLACLVLPVGRTMKHIDLYGIAVDGKKVFAQVTFHTFDSAGSKLGELAKYGLGNDCHLILFCNTSAQMIRSGVTVFPIATVYQSFVSTPTGRRWLSVAKGQPVP